MKRKVEWTDQELSRLRRMLIATYYQENRESPKEITCDKCQWAIKSTCVFVYDPYNTDGDCLGAK